MQNKEEILKIIERSKGGKAMIDTLIEHLKEEKMEVEWNIRKWEKRLAEL